GAHRLALPRLAGPERARAPGRGALGRKVPDLPHHPDAAGAQPRRGGPLPRRRPREGRRPPRRAGGGGRRRPLPRAPRPPRRRRAPLAGRSRRRRAPLGERLTVRRYLADLAPASWIGMEGRTTKGSCLYRRATRKGLLVFRAALSREGRLLQLLGGLLRGH